VAKIVDTLQHLADSRGNFDCMPKIYLFSVIQYITHCIFFVVGGCVFYLRFVRSVLNTFKSFSSVFPYNYR